MKLTRDLASEPGLHLLQFGGRALFALLVTLYLVQAGTLPLPVEVGRWMLWVGLGLFLFAHLGLILRPVPGASGVASALDLIATAIIILLDPGEPPPTMVLLLVSLISAGVVHGPRRFAWVLGGAIALLALVITARTGETRPSVSAGTFFLLATLLVCVLYFGLMVYRNQVLAKQAREATWRDPETGLISHAAMLSTAGWMLPLHDRLSATLSLVLLAPEDPADLKTLADQVATRLRRSDVAARYNEDALAVLLPDTDAGATEALLTELRDSAPACRAAMSTMTNPEHSLEAMLGNLQRALARSGREAGHWLVHATRL